MRYKKNPGYWVYLPWANVSVCAPPKCANRSILYSLVCKFYPSISYNEARPTEYRNNREFYQYSNNPESENKIAIIRDPVSRFLSLWSHHYRDGAAGIPRHLRFNNVSMNGLMDFIEKYDHDHLLPQSTIIGDHKNIQYCKIDDASVLLKSVAGLDMKKVNVTHKKELFATDSIIERVHKYYASDLVIYE